MRFLPLILALASTGCVSTMLGLTPLQQAAYDGDGARVDALIAQGADPGRVESNGSDAIGWAIERHPEVARRMLARCVDDSASSRCPRALVDAASLGDEAAATKAGAETVPAPGTPNPWWAK